MTRTHYNGDKATLNTCEIAIDSGAWANPFTPYPTGNYGLAESLRLYREYIQAQLEDGRLDLSPLHYSNLACTCPKGEPCHGDVLLEIVNNEIRSGREHRRMLEHVQKFTESMEPATLAGLYKFITSQHEPTPEELQQSEALEDALLRNRLASRNLYEVFMLYAETYTNDKRAINSVAERMYNYIFDIEEALQEIKQTK